MVGSRGDPKGSLCIIGESPGKNEVRLKVPFVGEAGKLLWSMFDDKQMSDKAFTCNAMQCVPMEKGKGKKQKKDPAVLAQAAKCCHDHLVTMVSTHPRRLILALGNAALWSITNWYDFKITQERGRLLQSEYAELGVLPIVHPAALIRGTENFRQFEEDFRYAQRLMNHGWAQVKYPVEPEIIVHSKPEDAYKTAVELAGTEVTADAETSSLNARTGRLLCLGICNSAEKVHVFPEEVLEHITPVFEDEGTRWCWHNGKFDLQFIRNDDRTRGNKVRVDDDTLLMSYAQDEYRGVHDLEQVASDVLSAPDYKHIVKQWVHKKTDSYELIPKPVLYQRNGTDLSLTYQVKQIYRQNIAADPVLEKLYTKTLIPYAELLARVEDRGFYVNIEQLYKNGDKYVGNFQKYLDDEEIDWEAEGEIQKAKKVLTKMIGYDFNPNSPIQVAEILYDKLKMPMRYGRSTDKKVLKLLPTHPFIKELGNYRGITKAFGTYVTSILWKIEGDGCVHSTFLIQGTPTGRTASRGPNIQNIPRDKDLRSTFMARPGYRLLEVDLNQAELRSLACTSGDKYLVELYNAAEEEERSLHDEMAEFLALRSGDQYNRDNLYLYDGDRKRMRAKAVNFGIPYIQEAGSLGEEFAVPTSEAQEWIDGWFSKTHR